VTIRRRSRQAITDDLGQLAHEPSDPTDGLVELLLPALRSLRPACCLCQLPTALLLPRGGGGQLRLQLRDLAPFSLRQVGCEALGRRKGVGRPLWVGPGRPLVVGHDQILGVRN
jgi:hypothetical protein